MTGEINNLSLQEFIEMDRKMCELESENAKYQKILADIEELIWDTRNEAVNGKDSYFLLYSVEFSKLYNAMKLDEPLDEFMQSALEAHKAIIASRNEGYQE